MGRASRRKRELTRAERIASVPTAEQPPAIDFEIVRRGERGERVSLTWWTGRRRFGFVEDLESYQQAQSLGYALLRGEWGRLPDRAKWMHL